MDDRGGPHVHRVPGVVGSDQQVRVVVVVHVHAPGQGPAECSDLFVETARIDDLKYFNVDINVANIQTSFPGD